MKKILSILLTACLLLTALPLTASAAEAPGHAAGEIQTGTTGDCTWQYDDSDKTLTISGNGAMADYNRANVLSSDSDAPWPKAIETVIVEDGVTYIGKYAFYASRQTLKTLFIPDSVTGIGEYAVNSMFSLFDRFDVYAGKGTAAESWCNSTSVCKFKLHHGTTGDCRWSYGTPDITKLTISGQGDMGGYGGYTWSEHEFSPWGKNITEAVIEEGVTRVGWNCFLESSKLTKVTLPSTLTYIDKDAFQKCTALQSVVIPEGVKQIHEGAFGNCSSLATVELPESLLWIDAGAFRACTSLQTVTIPKNVRKIHENSFKGCTSLEHVYIMGNSTQFDENVFAECNSGLVIHGYKSSPAYTYATAAGITFRAFPGVTGECVYTYEDGVVTISGNGAMADYGRNGAPWGTDVKKVVIEEGVTNVGKCAFYSNEALTEVILPSTVQTIGSEAFAWCKGLPSVSVPEGVTVIEERVFFQASSLSSITLPSTIREIKSYAFYVCPFREIDLPEGLTTIGKNAFLVSNIASVHIPASCIAIDDTAFSSCTNISTITVAPGNPVYDSRNNCNAIIETTSNRLIRAANNATLFEGITSINTSALSGYSAERLVLPQSVTSIGSDAFYKARCKEIILPRGTQAIGSQAFAMCKQLKSVYIPASATVLGDALLNGANTTATVYVEKGSAAQLYCENKGIAFAAMGDSNRDNKVSIKDVTAVQRHLAEFDEITDAFAADTDFDNSVTISDATYVQQKLAEFF